MDTTRSSNTTIHKSTRSPPKVVHISPLISLTTAHPESQWPQLVTGESSPSDAGVDHWGELSSQSETRDDPGLGQSQTMPGPVTYYRLEKLNEVSIILTGHHTALWQQTALELSNNIALIIGQQGLRWKICDIFPSFLHSQARMRLQSGFINIIMVRLAQVLQTIRQWYFIFKPGHVSCPIQMSARMRIYATLMIFSTLILVHKTAWVFPGILTPSCWD